jgi:hypothetical protein
MTPLDFLLLETLIKTATSQFMLWQQVLSVEEKQAKVDEGRSTREDLMAEGEALHGG